MVLNFVVGFPEETEKGFEATLDFIKRNKDYISNITPAHECDIAFSNIYYNPQHYNVVLHRMSDHIKLWKTFDGKNTFEERKRRKNIFDKFVAELKIPIKCGIDDRKEFEYSSNKI